MEKGLRYSGAGLLLVLLLILPSCKKTIKEPSVAGAFYPADPAELSKMVDGYLSAADPPPLDGELIILFSPHAGYIYSGEIAAHTYKAIRNRHIKRIILIGPSHHALFKGASIYTGDYFKTPLGLVPVDLEIAESLIHEEADCRYYPEAYTREHSLEVQLPFLQKSLSDFSVVQILIGQLTRKSFQFLTERLTEILRRDRSTMVIVSTDLSHYHQYEKAVEMDRAVIDAIKRLSIEDLEQLLQSRKGEMCGSYPAILGLSVARAIGATHGTLLKYANSGDTAGRKDSVVGYASIAVLKAPLSSEEKQFLLELARKTVKEYVTTGKIPEVDVKEGRLLANGATFVTLKKNGHILRGCIGNIIPVMPLYKSVIRNAVSAATRDPRFPPVTVAELQDLEVEVTVLSPLEKIINIDDIEVGKHGLYIVKGNRSGLLLPQVATEFGWNRFQFLQAVSEKAGLPPDAWQEATLYRFTAEIIR